MYKKISTQMRELRSQNAMLITGRKRIHSRKKETPPFLLSSRKSPTRSVGKARSQPPWREKRRMLHMPKASTLLRNCAFSRLRFERSDAAIEVPDVVPAVVGGTREVCGGVNEA